MVEVAYTWDTNIDSFKYAIIPREATAMAWGT